MTQIEITFQNCLINAEKLQPIPGNVLLLIEVELQTGSHYTESEYLQEFSQAKLIAGKGNDMSEPQQGMHDMTWLVNVPDPQGYDQQLEGQSSTATTLSGWKMAFPEDPFLCLLANICSIYNSTNVLHPRFNISKPLILSFCKSIFQR